MVCLQRAMRRRQNRFAEMYRALDEIGRLKEQVRRLTEEMRAKDAWIFRANILLRKFVTDKRRLTPPVGLGDEVGLGDDPLLTPARG